MAIRTVTTSTTDPTQNNMAEFTAEFNARKAVIGKNDGAPNPNVTIGRRATAGDDSSAAEAAAAVKAAADKAAADAAAAAAGDKKGAKPGELDDLHDEADGDKKKKGLDARFSKLTGEREQAKRERDEATARADKLQAQIDAIDAAKQAVADAKPAPVPTDFKTPEEYAEALAEFKVEKKLAEKAKQDAKTALEAANLAVIADFNKRVAEARKELPDYDEVTSTSPVPVHDFVKNLLIESPVGPWVLHWLATHPDRVTNINAMAEKGNLRGASISFGRLEQQIEDDRDTARAPSCLSASKVTRLSVA